MDFDTLGNSSAAPRLLATISLSSILKLLGGDCTIAVLVKPAEPLGRTFEFVSLHLAIFVSVMACRELLESDAALAWLILLGLLCCFVGVLPALAWTMLADAHTNWQLYEVYLARGGKPVRLKVDKPGPVVMAEVL